MEIKSSLNFYYDSQDSQTFGISNVSVSTGMYEEPFVAPKEIIKQEIRGRTKPYHSGIKRSSIILNLSFAFNETWNNQKMRDVKNWLDQDFFKPLMIPADPNDSTDFNRVYYCMLTSDSSKLIHNGLMQGYVDGLTFECNDSYYYSEPQLISRNLFNNPSPGGTELIINNTGDTPCYPLITITKSIEDGTISIFNRSNTNKEMQITGLSNGEITTIDCEEQIIDSIYNNQNIYRYDSHNGYFLELLTGNNNLLIKGKCEITIQSEFKYK